MRVALLSDVHGNEVALSTVLDDLPEVDRVVCAGDVVGYNPWPAACVETVRDRGIPTVVGNHDRAVANDTGFRFNDMAAAGVDYARAELDDDQIGWLEGLPRDRTLADGRLCVVHDHPERQDHYTMPDEFDPSLLAAAGDPDVLVLGHTHVQHHETFAEGVVVNPGSVGQPRDGDPRAAYAVVDLDDLSVTQHRVSYDIDAVDDAVSEAGLPEKIGKRLHLGK